nr:Gfo/Idh/MocA family oxidoreductase [Methyloceanibacter superfactus]
MAELIRTAVVGTGYFGRFHANHYTKNPRAQLVAVVDTNAARAAEMAAEFGPSRSPIIVTSSAGWMR